MRIPIIRGTIDRRILINYRVEPAALAKVLPAPFRPQLFDGLGIAGICLIRLKGIRPRFAPKLLGVASENAAHRIAVEWDAAGRRQTGVFIPRRDTSSRFNTLVGGRLFPGVHHHAHFDVHERDDRYRVALESDDGKTRVSVDGSTARQWPATSIFPSLQAASDFFERGALGYSIGSRPAQFDGLELRCQQWSMTPLAVERVESSFFENVALFPAGTATFDCALLMRGIEHQWLGREVLCCGAR